MTNTNFDWQIDEFMVYCRSNRLREKTMNSYLDLTDEDLGKRYQHYSPVGAL